MRDRYRRAMEALYVACICISGAALAAITLIIPAGVFMRYAMNSPLSWPEPASVIMMVIFSFIGGAAVFRANLHIAVQALLDKVGPSARKAMLMAVDACMAATALFMVVYGTQLCLTTRFQSMAEFPGLPVAVVYLPIPIAGLLTLLFLVERVWLGPAPSSSVMFGDQPVGVE